MFDEETFDAMKPIHGTNIAKKMAANVSYHDAIDQCESIEDIRYIMHDLIDMLLPTPD